jgi:hypothetical protein
VDKISEAAEIVRAFKIKSPRICYLTVPDDWPRGWIDVRIIEGSQRQNMIHLASRNDGTNVEVRIYHDTNIGRLDQNPAARKTLPVHRRVHGRQSGGPDRRLLHRHAGLAERFSPDCQGSPRAPRTAPMEPN